MQINSTRLVELAGILMADIAGICCESAVTIGRVDGITFRLVAMDEREADDQDIDGPLPKNECLTA